MKDMDELITDDGQRPGAGKAPVSVAAGVSAAWSFVYIFFTNGIPFDAPNRSEPCPRP